MFWLGPGLNFLAQVPMVQQQQHEQPLFWELSWMEGWGGFSWLFFSSPSHTCSCASSFVLEIRTDEGQCLCGPRHCNAEWAKKSPKHEFTLNPPKCCSQIGKFLNLQLLVPFKDSSPFWLHFSLATEEPVSLLGFLLSLSSGCPSPPLLTMLFAPQGCKHGPYGWILVKENNTAVKIRQKGISADIQNWRKNPQRAVLAQPYLLHPCFQMEDCCLCYLLPPPPKK